MKRRILILLTVSAFGAAVPSAEAQQASNCADFAQSRVDDNARFTAVALTFFGLRKLADPGPPVQAQHVWVCGDGRARVLVRHEGALVFKGGIEGGKKRFTRRRTVLVLNPTRKARSVRNLDEATLTIKFRMFDRNGKRVAEQERFISVTGEGTE